MEEESESPHAALFSTGSWKASGCFFDEKENATLAEGHTQIFRCSRHWFIRSSFLLSDGRKIENVYQVEALGGGVAEWTSRSSLLRECRGKFLVLGDLILSTFRSEDGQFSGLETLRKLDDSHYRNRGQLFFSKHKHSSWSFEFRRSTKAIETVVKESSLESSKSNPIPVFPH